MKWLFIWISLLALSCVSAQEWEPLFDGEHLPDNNHYLGVPDRSIEVPGMERNADGDYTGNLGWEDPLGVFSVVQLEGEPVIRISGAVQGALVLKKSVGNYHLRLQFKWGDVRWDWALDKPRNSGILYHHGGGKGHEFNLHEGNLASYWSKKAGADIPCVITEDLAESVQVDYAAYQALIPSIAAAMPKFDPRAHIQRFEDDGEWTIVTAEPLTEKSPGAWNTLELVCWGDNAMHIVNGQICLILLNGHVQREGAIQALEAGRLALQSEGTEIFFKDIEMRHLDPARITSPEAFREIVDYPSEYAPIIEASFRN